MARSWPPRGSPTARHGWQPRSNGRGSTPQRGGGASAARGPGPEWPRAPPLGGKAFSHRRVKNDELDARDLADLLRMGRLAEAWIAPAEIRALPVITRHPGQLVAPGHLLQEP